MSVERFAGPLHGCLHAADSDGRAGCAAEPSQSCYGGIRGSAATPSDGPSSRSVVYYIRKLADARSVDRTDSFLNEHGV
jgi:hypothetical protein